MSSPAAADIAGNIATSVARMHADEVHSEGRFPFESIAALREGRLLGALVPVALGGTGASVTEMVKATCELSSECANTGMVFAMHHIQVGILVRHGNTPELQLFLAELADRQLLIANAFSEVGVGGDARRSICALEGTDGGYRVEKHASVLSYGAYSDAVLVSARRSPDAQPEDQSIVLCRPPELVLEPTGEWDAIGLRGTDSRPFRLTAGGPEGYILPESGGDILNATGVVINNLFQGAVWLGIAEGAARRAHRYLRAKRDASTAAWTRLSGLATELQQLRDTIDHGARVADAIFAGDDEAGVRTALTMNLLKVSTSTLAVEVVQAALIVCGFEGFRNGSPYSLGRYLSDAHAGLVMVNNDRVLLGSSQILELLRQI